ncbi:molybdenum cofactor guanylyltransferase [Paenibacillus elgii]|uniref:Molybdenum cofactor guanylyltransferase n=1 Tax=Paenibacillus elgii TaxID=189691 RepID=A0A163WGZ9_9BACL|nr:molybdenum cofactor guanylyltransferase [Paenibacillus elgii]KZE76346.1 hypothetical protein AV654_23025 [Paenibacillus elgii]NEN83277.1 molybdenum cofactor guanylyltransferase [Paenibacillus elgii]PUA38816.1 molybdenum cofactor guanylyltransferase [Paenibacillus elgii]
MMTGVLLAGGHPRRIEGRPAELLVLAGETVVAKQIREMLTICGEVIIVTNEPKIFLEHVPRSVRIITDFYPGRGPLGGLHAALTLSRYPELWVTGGAMPFISARAASFLAEHRSVFGYDAVLPEVSGRPEPLHGIYRQSCLTALMPLLESGSDVQPGWMTFLRKLRWGCVEADMLRKQNLGDAFTFRIKTEKQYSEAVSRAQALVRSVYR